MIESLNCCLFDSLDDASPWITLKHTGQNGGAGIVEWNRIQALRQAIKEGKKVPDRGFLLVDWLEDTGHLPEVGIDSYDDIKNTTTLIRLLEDPAVLKEIKLSYDKEQVIESSDEELTVKFISRFVRDLNSGKLPVGRVYSSDDRITYIKELEKELGVSKKTVQIDPEGFSKRNEEHSLKDASDASSTSANDDNNNTNKELGNSKPSRATPGSPNLSTRKKIIPGKDRYITGTDGKASEVLKELRKINCSEMPIASALLIRCFYEMTTKSFVKALSIQVERRLQSHLGELIFKCKERIISNGTDEQKENAEKFLIKVDRGFHVIEQLEDLNKVIHDTDVVRDKVFFFTTWDTFRPFMQDLWSIINEQNKKSK